MSAKRLQSKSGQAISALKADIIRGVLPPGGQVSEIKVAKRYGVGRAGARVALQRLAGAGLVQARPRQGYVIAGITIRDARDVFQLRLELEPLAARLAAGRVDAGLLRRLEAEGTSLYRHAGPLDRMIACNRQIHLHIAAASGNARLAGILAQLLDDTDRVLMIGLAHGRDVPRMIQEHTPLIEALAAGKADRAAALAREHVETSRRNVMDGLTQQDAVLDQSLGGAA